MSALAFVFPLLLFVAPVPRQTVELRDIEFERSNGQTVAAQAGDFEVPSRRDDKKSKTLTLRFVRFPSRSAEPGPPIVYLAGGPGGSGVDAAKGARWKMFDALRDVADVIAFDQRGTGGSDAPPRAADGWGVSFRKPVERAVLESCVEDYARECAAQWREQGVDLAAFNTLEMADDLEDLRLALGAETIQLLAISYGTHLALATVRRHPNSIERIVLAGCEGLDQTVKPPRQQQALLEEIERRIALDPKASVAFPHFLRDLERLLESAEREPLEGVVTRFDLQRRFASMLRGPDSFAGLPLLVQRLSKGDIAPVTDSFWRLRSGWVGAMSGATDAASGVSRERAERVRREATQCLLGDAINFPYASVRAGLDVPDLGDAFRDTFESDVPAFFLSGSLDGRTPPENAEDTRTQFTTSAHWILDGAGHGDPLFLGSPRVVPAIASFFRGEGVKDRTIELPPVRFTLP